MSSLGRACTFARIINVIVSCTFARIIHVIVCRTWSVLCATCRLTNLLCLALPVGHSDPHAACKGGMLPSHLRPLQHIQRQGREILSFTKQFSPVATLPCESLITLDSRSTDRAIGPWLCWLRPVAVEVLSLILLVFDWMDADSSTAALSLSWLGGFIARAPTQLLPLAAPILAAVLPSLSHPTSDIAQVPPTPPPPPPLPDARSFSSNFSVVSTSGLYCLQCSNESCWLLWSSPQRTTSLAAHEAYRSRKRERLN